MAPDLSEEGIRRWLGVLPADLRACLGDEAALPDGAAAALAREVSDASPALAARVLASDPGAVLALGRPRRVRLMAWVVRSALSEEGDENLPGSPVPPSATAALSELLGEDEAGEGGRSGEAGRILFEDFLAMARALGPRLGMAVVNPGSIARGWAAGVGAGLELEDRVGMGR